MELNEQHRELLRLHEQDGMIMSEECKKFMRGETLTEEETESVKRFFSGLWPVRPPGPT